MKKGWWSPQYVCVGPLLDGVLVEACDMDPIPSSSLLLMWYWKGSASRRNWDKTPPLCLDARTTSMCPHTNISSSSTNFSAFSHCNCKLNHSFFSNCLLSLQILQSFFFLPSNFLPTHNHQQRQIKLLPN